MCFESAKFIGVDFFSILIPSSPLFASMLCQNFDDPETAMLLSSLGCVHVRSTERDDDETCFSEGRLFCQDPDKICMMKAAV